MSGPRRQAHTAGVQEARQIQEGTMTAMVSIDQDKLMSLVGQAVNDIGAIYSGSLVVAGDKLGLYRALRDKGPVTSAELAAATGTTERYVREWLNSQAASGYVSYDGADRYQ